MADWQDFVAGAAAANNVDPDLMARIARIESSGNPAARTGSYKGLFQLSDSEFAKYGGGDIYNAADNSRAAGAKLAAETAAFNQRYGRQPTATEIYLIHQQGQGGFDAHNSNPDQPAWRSMASTAEGRQKGEGWARQAIWGNVPDNLKPQFGSVDNLTSQQFMDLWRHKVEGGGTPTAMSYAPTTQRGALSPPLPQGQSNMPTIQEEPSLGAKFIAGGPGALFGAPGGVFRTAEGKPGYDLGHSLQRAGAWAMALDNPNALAVAAQMAKPQDEFTFHATPDGTVYRMSKKTGGLLAPIQGGQKVDPSVIKAAQEGYQQSTMLHDASTEAQKHIDAIKSGQLDLGLATRGRAAVENLFGASSPQTQLYNSFEQFRTQAANAILQAAKGTQTEGDAKRAYDQFLSALAANDSKSAVQAMEKLKEVNGKLIGAHKTGLDAYSKLYPNTPALGPFQEGYGKMLPFYTPKDTAAPTRTEPTKGDSQRRPLGDIFK